MFGGFSPLSDDPWRMSYIYTLILKTLVSLYPSSFSHSLSPLSHCFLHLSTGPECQDLMICLSHGLSGELTTHPVC